MGILVSAAIATSCYNLGFNNGAGTCFARRCAKGPYFVTAAHCLTGAAHNSTVLIAVRNANPVRLTINTIAFGNGDICAFSVQNLGPNDPPSCDSTAIGSVASFGADLSFLGFPHGLDNAFDANYRFPTPLVKSATLSGIIGSPPNQTLVLDGHNNPGFSGGPVYGAGTGGALVLVGVISGYIDERAEHTRVYDASSSPPTPAGNLFSKGNSGMIQCVPSEAIRDLENRL